MKYLCGHGHGAQLVQAHGRSRLAAVLLHNVVFERGVRKACVTCQHVLTETENIGSSRVSYSRVSVLYLVQQPSGALSTKVRTAEPPHFLYSSSSRGGASTVAHSLYSPYPKGTTAFPL